MADPETQTQPEEQPKAPVKEKEVLGKWAKEVEISIFKE